MKGWFEMSANNTEIQIELAEKVSAKNYNPLPVVLSHGEGVWVTDVDGNRYMDMLSAYSSVNQGHRHPKIMKALTEQAERITITSRAFHNDKMGPFLKKLCELSGFEQALPMNTGAEAVETAIKTVRKWAYLNKGITDGEIIACENNFHGRTVTAISFSSEEQYKEGFGPYTPGFKLVPYGDIAAMEAAFTDKTIGVLLEPIQGEAGVIVPPEGYLEAVRKLCTEKCALMMLDEIQTGFCRTGKMFAHMHENARPDIMVVGKALGGGVYPVSAMLADSEIMNVFRPGDHGSTFGGNPLAAAVGHAALQVLVDESLAEKSQELGDYFMKSILAIGSPAVKEVRGKGLLIGVDIDPVYGDARKYCKALMACGILCKETHHTVIRFAPPLTISPSDLDWAIAQIAGVLSDEKLFSAE